METTQTLHKAKNIGATIEKTLNDIGIFTLADLAERTPKQAYKDICEMHPNKTIPKCYYLYSLQGAVMDLNWRKLPEDVKAELL